MNHLDEAREWAKAIDELLEEGNHSKPYDGNTLAIAHALIAIAERQPFIESALLQIAEQLEKIVKGIELPRIVIETPED